MSQLVIPDSVPTITSTSAPPGLAINAVHSYSKTIGTMAFLYSSEL